MKTVKKHQLLDFVVNGLTNLENPFFAELFGKFVDPNGKVYLIPGFYIGENKWTIRFSANFTGLWQYTVESRHIKIHPEDTAGTVMCVDAPGHGAVELSKDNPFRLSYEDGSDYFMMGYEANWIWAMPVHEIEEFSSQIAEYGFNMLITNVYAHDCSWELGNTSERDFGPPPLYLWEGSNENPDHSHMNLEFFRHYDAFMNIILQKGINVCLYFKVYNKMVNWMEKESPEEELYIRYITARYQAYPNVVWCFSKEAFYEADKDYIGWYIDRIRGYDAYGRLMTSHDDSEFSELPEKHKKLDFISLQHHEHSYNWPDFYFYSLYRKQIYQKPLFMIEIGYECGKSGVDDLTYNVGHTAEGLLDIALDVVFAQSYPTYYYTYTAWDVIDYSYIPTGYLYFRNMANIVKRFQLFDWKIEMPTLSACPKRLVKSETEQMLFFERGRSFSINYAALRRFAGKQICAEWINVQKDEVISADITKFPTWPGSQVFIRVDPPNKDEVFLLHLWLI